jgi:hypothetical protein
LARDLALAKKGHTPTRYEPFESDLDLRKMLDLVDGMARMSRHECAMAERALRSARVAAALWWRIWTGRGLSSGYCQVAAL